MAIPPTALSLGRATAHTVCDWLRQFIAKTALCVTPLNLVLGGTLDTQSTLTTVAEVGIAIVGFSTIAAAFVSRGVGVDKLALWITLRSLLRTSAAVTFFAFLPMVLLETSLDTSTVWVISSFVYMAWLGAVRISLFFDREAQAVTGFSAFVYSWFGAISLAFHLYNVVFERTGWPYLAALITGLFIAFTQFYSLVRNLVTFTVEKQRDGQDDA